MSDAVKSTPEPEPRAPTKKEMIRHELLAIHDANPDELLIVDEVVAYARDNTDSTLHGEFEWDTDKAAIEHWRSQARGLIRVHVVVLKPETEPVRCWVSLENDRLRRGGGYRTTVKVMSEAEHRLQLLAQAICDANRWRRKYAVLKELSTVFNAIDAASDEAS